MSAGIEANKHSATNGHKNSGKDSEQPALRTGARPRTTRRSH